MRVSLFSDFALRVLVYLALVAPERATISDIATAYGISRHHLTKVVHLLGRAGWIRTTRGKHGGMALAMPAAQIRLGQVLRSCDGDTDVAPCRSATTGDCRIAGVCLLAGYLDEARAAFYAELDRRTLADLLTPQQALNTLLLAES